MRGAGLAWGERSYNAAAFAQSHERTLHSMAKVTPDSSDVARWHLANKSAPPDLPLALPPEGQCRHRPARGNRRSGRRHTLRRSEAPLQQPEHRDGKQRHPGLANDLTGQEVKAAKRQREEERAVDGQADRV